MSAQHSGGLMTIPEPGAAVNATMWETVPRLLDQLRYLVLGTVDQAGVPWTTPVFFAADGVHRMLWVSSPDSRHSRNIAANPKVAITVFDSTVPVGKAEAVYFEATAGLADDHDHALALFKPRLPADRQLSPDDLGPAGRMRLYEARVSQHYVL